jgi:hypothetical protein
MHEFFWFCHFHTTFHFDYILGRTGLSARISTNVSITTTRCFEPATTSLKVSPLQFLAASEVLFLAKLPTQLKNALAGTFKSASFV